MCTFLLNSLSEKFLIIGWYSIYIFGFINWMFQSHLWYIICLAIMGCPHEKAGFLQEVPITMHLKASLSGFSDCVSYYSFITYSCYWKSNIRERLLNILDHLRFPLPISVLRNFINTHGMICLFVHIDNLIYSSCWGCHLDFKGPFCWQGQIDEFDLIRLGGKISCFSFRL